MAQIRTLIIGFLLLLLLQVLSGCRFSPAGGTPTPTEKSRPGVIPTWTPRSAAQEGAPPTATRPAAATAAPTGTPAADRKVDQVTIKVTGGNLNLRRGPSVDYNTVGVLEDGQEALATGRDLVRRWLLVERPTTPGKTGWVSTLTDYSEVRGDVDSLPVVEVSPAEEAVIRNCTKHTLIVRPGGVQLLPKANVPYNEERFSPGEYQVYDRDSSNESSIREVNLREGLEVEVTRDGDGSKSKCE